MDEPNLLQISGVAFVAVMAILSLPSLLMEGLVRIFPAPALGSNEGPQATLAPATPLPFSIDPSPAELAAIHAAARQHFPHMQVTQIRATEDR